AERGLPARLFFHTLLSVFSVSLCLCGYFFWSKPPRYTEKKALSSPGPYPSRNSGHRPMIGTRLGSWVLEREIGRGGMGCVYLARRAAAMEGLPERAAVKVLAAHLTFDAGLLARFQREIDVLRQLDHPHIVRLFEAGTENGR